MTAIRDSSTALLKKVQRSIAQYTEKDQAYCESVVSTLVDSGQELGISGARVWHVEGEYAVLKYQLGGSKPLDPNFAISIGYKPVQDVIQNGVSIMKPGDPGYDSTLEERLGVGSFVAAKISDDYFVSIDIGDLVRAELILSFLSATLTTTMAKRRSTSLTKFARDQQMLLMPKKPYSLQASFDFAFYSIPAAEAGGDFLKFSPKDDGLDDEATLAIGDASGHGIEAAHTAALVYFGLDLVKNINLRSAIRDLNSTLRSCTTTDSFVTLADLAVHANGEIQYVNAGQPWPLIAHRWGVEKLTNGGPFIGGKDLFPINPRYQLGSARMEPGDVLLLFTDGLSDLAKDEKTVLGDKLEDIVAEHVSKSPQEIVDAILKEALAWNGDTKIFEDDITFAALKMK